jgi:mannose/fructose/N-acetylgalactosamine-specific phosphotransferase system component IIC
MTIPHTTDTIAIPIEIIAVFLKPLPNNIAVIFGSTISADIKRTPTSLIDVTTVIAASTMKT